MTPPLFHCRLFQDHQGSWQWSVWYSEQGYLAESSGSHGCSCEAAPAWSLREREGQVPPGGSH